MPFRINPLRCTQSSPVLYRSIYTQPWLSPHLFPPFDPDVPRPKLPSSTKGTTFDPPTTFAVKPRPLTFYVRLHSISSLSVHPSDAHMSLQPLASSVSHHLNNPNPARRSRASSDDTRCPRPLDRTWHPHQIYSSRPTTYARCRDERVPGRGQGSVG